MYVCMKERLIEVRGRHGKGERNSKDSMLSMKPDGGEARSHDPEVTT